MSITIRQATTNDQKAIEDCMKGHDDAIKPRKIRYQAKVCLENCTVMLAVDSNARTVIGFIAFRYDAATPRLEPAHVFIKMLFVRKGSDRKGAGSMLLRSAFDYAASQKAYIKTHAASDAGRLFFAKHNFRTHSYTHGPGATQHDNEYWLFQVPASAAARRVAPGSVRGRGDPATSMRPGVSPARLPGHRRG